MAKAVQLLFFIKLTNKNIDSSQLSNKIPLNTTAISYPIAIQL